MRTVPFADLYTQYLSIKDDIDTAIADVISSSAFIRGPFVDSFEAAFSEMMERKHCVSCASGTDALYIAMKALGVGPGDEVICPAHSWISTSETITQAGGRVVFCDTTRDTFTIDPDQIEAHITPRTVGIIPVHLYGQAADMSAVERIAQKHGLWIIEDCAQAHLARHQGRLVGTFGQAATFSFYPGKNLGAMGDAGAIVTNDDALARNMAMFARHGGLKKGQHDIEGINSRLDGLQAAILTAKLPRLPDWTASRQQKAALYDQGLACASDLTLPVCQDGHEHVYHLYVVRHDRRDELASVLKQHGVQTVINYPVALPFLPAYAHINAQPNQFANAFSNQSRVLSLPLFAELGEDDQRYVIETVIAACDRLS